MKTAEEMRRQSEKNFATLDRIETEIDQCSKSGQTSVNFYCGMSSATVEALMRAGYSVSISKDPIGIEFYTVKW